MKEGTYYAVIFTSLKKPDDEGYAEMAQKMVDLAREQPGFLDVESARDEIGITVSYWKDLESIAAWKVNLDHQKAQARGIKDWYQWYRVRICRVEREYSR
ncbi:antibiotic biosynthesis monooxygenase [Euzebyella marina]|uniref:Antibiotic biosynthesis monooxygenase n=1 Tax=Euzebyella marina TaxID=1761453 RepID=A0A3G2L0V0_9FLAO|nr:antibiotic biosynthesis monooxygenase [Euzebyella marina]AYN65883.1 antibiotic biosynthesis monooxygenase [Euzebyella marina]AYN69529.1 antibiotic biosynthesis monooxygenase [Euzebyella marina]